MQEFSSKVHIPRICCRCAEKAGTKRWKAHYSQPNYLGLANRIKSKEVNVLICDSCFMVLRNSRLIYTSLLIISTLTAVIISIYLPCNDFQNDFWNSIFKLFMISGIGFFIVKFAMFIINRIFLKANLMKYDETWDQIIFKNCRYNAEFEQLNFNKNK